MNDAPLWRQMLEARERAGPLPALQIAAELDLVIDYLAPGGLIPRTWMLEEQAALAREHAARHAAPTSPQSITLTPDQEEAIERNLHAGLWLTLAAALAVIWGLSR